MPFVASDVDAARNRRYNRSPFARSCRGAAQPPPGERHEVWLAPSGREFLGSVTLSADRQKFVRESGSAVSAVSVHAEMSFRYSPQLQSSASSGVSVNPPLGRKESS